MPLPGEPLYVPIILLTVSPISVMRATFLVSSSEPPSHTNSTDFMSAKNVASPSAITFITCDIVDSLL